MNEAKARKILGKAIRPNDRIDDIFQYKLWPSGADGTDHNSIVLDDSFTVDELEAIVWWMRNKKVKIKKELAL